MDAGYFCTEWHQNQPGEAEAQAEEFQRFIVSDYDQGFPAGPT